MDSEQHTCYTLGDRSYLAPAKREIRSLAFGMGFSATQQAEIDIVVAEITSNLIKHAKFGELLVKKFAHQNASGIEIIAIDSGPGILELSHMMKDGASTKGTLGQGLGAIERLSDESQIYSLPAWGTILLARKYIKKPTRIAEKVSVRSINVPKPTEHISGDGIYGYLTPDYYKVICLDGLGHGPEAHAASQKAIEEFKNCPFHNAAQTVRYIHPLIKRTRGAVGTVAIYSFKDKKWNMCGVGNITTRYNTNLQLKSYIPYNGILGLTLPKTLKENTIAQAACNHLFMASDGIKAKWDLSKYPNILKNDLSIAAAALYKDFGRKTDDMSIVISKVNV